MEDLNKILHPRPKRTRDKIVVVTGGSGFIGGACVELLQEDDTVSEIRILDVVFPDYKLKSKMRYFRVDMTDLASVIKYSKDADEWIDNVGLLGTGDYHELGASPMSALNVNVNGYLNQIEAAYVNRVPTFFHQTKNRFDTVDGTENGLSENWYTATKSMAEIVSFWARKSRGQQITVVRYLNASGPRQHLGPTRKLFPLAVVSGILDLDFSVYGDGEQLADFIHVNDLASAAILFMRADSNDTPIKTIDIGTGQAISVISLINTIKSKLDCSSEIQYLPMRKGEIADTRIRASSSDVCTAKSMGWSISYTGDDVVGGYIDYYLNNFSDYTYIYNTLKYFQDTYNEFSMGGKPIKIETHLTIDIIRDKFESKAEMLKGKNI